MTKELTCINCPMGCLLTAELDGNGDVTSVSGNTCPRGASYAKDELTHPKRVVTALCRIIGSNSPLSVKTDKPIAKELVFACLREISGICISTPVHIGDVVLEHVCNTDVNVIATQNR